MATQAQKVRLALFFVVGAGVLIFFLFTVVGSRLLQKRDLYIVEYRDESVSGLSTGAEVRYLGVRIGRVARIYIDPEDINAVIVEVALNLKNSPDAIRTNTRAAIRSIGITGLKYIELIAGTQDAAILPPGSRIAVSESFISDIEARAEVLTRQIEQVLNNVILITGQENRTHFTHVLKESAELLGNLNGLVGDNRLSVHAAVDNLEQMTANLARTSISLQATVDTLQRSLTGDQLKATVSDLQQAVRGVRRQLEGPIPQLVANLSSMAGNLDTTITHVDLTVLQGRKNILSAMQNLEEMLQNIRQATEIIREDPSVLIRGRRLE